MPHACKKLLSACGLGLILWSFLCPPLGCAAVITQKQQDSARINYDLGVASLNKGDHREALRALFLAVEADPTLPQAHNALALVLHTMGKDADALVHYRRAVELHPTFSEAYNNMGILLLDSGHPKEAVEAFKTALGQILYNTPHLAEGNMGWAYYVMGDVDKAIEHISAAVAQQPRFCRGYQWLARIALERNNANSAHDMVIQSKRFIRHCLEDPTIAGSIAPDYRREMQYYLGLGHLKQGRTKLALEQFARCSAGYHKVLYDEDAAPEDKYGNRSEFARKCAQSAASIDPVAASPDVEIR